MKIPHSADVAPLDVLAHDAIDVWFAPVDDVLPETLAAWDATLSGDERERRDRFLFPEHRRQFHVAHGLVRATLSRYARIDPGDWAFDIGAHGRPEIRDTSGGRRLRFNLSHTHGLVAVAVAWERDIGVDVEAADRRAATLAIADRFFAPTEIAALRAAPAESQQDRFIRTWTLKEAYIKARGMGLALPLQQFAFELHEPDGATVAFDARLVDDPRAWFFAEVRPLPGHRLAIAARRSGAAALALRVRVWGEV